MKTVKYIAIVSGTLSFIVGTLLLLGRLPMQHIEANVLREGNALYNRGDYTGAQKVYVDGLSRVKGSESIAHNLGMTQYQLADYAGAIETFTASKANALVLGNTYYQLGTQQSGQEQIASYQMAVDTYFAGIVKEPQRFDLKFNYEFVKRLIDEQNQEQQSQDEQNQEQQNQDEQNQDEQNQDEQNQDEQNQDEQNQDEQNQDSRTKISRIKNSRTKTSKIKTSKIKISRTKRVIRRMPFLKKSRMPLIKYYRL
jgi:Ca-activated chloride channel homolog